MMIDDILDKFGIKSKIILEKFKGQKIHIPKYNLSRNRLVTAFVKEFGDNAITFFYAKAGTYFEINKNIDRVFLNALKRRHNNIFLKQYLKGDFNAK